MAIPVIAGIPFLAGLIGGILSSLLSFFSKYLSKRLALTAALVTLIVAATVAFIALIETVLSGLSAYSPQYLGSAVGLFLPPNFSSCMSAIIVIRTAAWAYSWNIKILQYKFMF